MLPAVTSERPGSRGNAASSSRPGSRGQGSPCHSKDWDFSSRPGSQPAGSQYGSLESRHGSQPASRPGSQPSGSQFGSFGGSLPGSRPNSHAENRGSALRTSGVSFQQEESPAAAAGSSSSEDEEEDDDSDEEERARRRQSELRLFAQPRCRKVNTNTFAQAMQTLMSDHLRYLEVQYNGFLIDYLVRNRARKTYGDYAKHMLDPEPKDIEADLREYDEGVEVVRSEKLQATICHIITSSYKNMQHKDWQCTGQEFREHARNIVNKLRAERSLNRAVKSMYILVKGWVRKLDLHETLREKQSRLKQFWASYHTSHKLVDSLAEKRDGEAPGPSKAKGTPETKSSQKSRVAWPGTPPRPTGRTKPVSPSAWYASSGCAEDEAIVPSDDAWKLRGSRSVISRGGSRSASRGGQQSPEKQALVFPSLLATAGAAEEESRVARSSGASRSANNKQISALNSLADWGFASSSPLFQKGKLRDEKQLAKVIGKLFETSPDTTPQKLRRCNDLAWSAPALLNTQKFGQAPSEKQKLLMPFGKNAGGHSLKNNKSCKSPSNSYLRACDTSGIVPSLLPFCTGHSPILNAAGQGLGDDDLSAVTEMLNNVSNLQVIDLGDNGLLTSKSLLPFLTGLKGPWVSRHLHKLSLKNCLKKAGRESSQTVLMCVADLLQSGLRNMKYLDLSGVAFDMKSFLPLCRAINEHPTLQHVGLNDVKLSYDYPHATTCVELLLSGSLQAIELGWNAFDRSIFRHLGECIVANSTIERLSVANCACSLPNGDSSVDDFLEMLEQDDTLTQIDLSLNRISFRGALVLESALGSNSILVSVDLSHNPLSTLGFRSVLRLLGRGDSAFAFFQCVGCCSVQHNHLEAESENNQVYSETNPTGRYKLRLERAYDRALLRMLYKTCDRFKILPDVAFFDTSPGYKHPVKGSFGTYAIPTSGEVEFSFSTAEAMEKCFGGIAEGNFLAVLERHSSLTRISPTFRKQVSIAIQFRQMEGQGLEQETMLDALSKDFLFSYSQFSQLCHHKSQVADVARRLMPCIVEGNPMRFLSLLKMPTQGTYLRFMREAKNYLLFNIENPTARYRLHLSSCCDFAVAEQLLILDRWESNLGRIQRLEIVSQSGFRTHFRNERYQDRPLDARYMGEFILPEHGDLQFDYSSGKQPSPNAKKLDAASFDKILLALQNAECRPEESVRAVAMMAHYWYLDCLQMRAIMGIYPDSHIRAEIFVRLAFHLTDIANEKVFRSRFSSQDEFNKLLLRLGHASFFPFVQPEETTFVFNFAYYDQRLAANMMFTLAQAENWRNIKDIQFTRADGTVDYLIAGIPQSWLKFECIETSGVFKAKYICSPDDRNYTFRRELAKKYGNRTIPNEKNVMWWSSINCCPPDVVEFVEFLNSNFKNIWEPFQIIDGPDGNGEIALSELEIGIKVMKCKKFDGDNIFERIKTVFRFLDPSGEGLISKNEWKVLDQLFQEVRLSVKEFVEFCERTFGPDLDDAWRALDNDSSGEIDEGEWQDALTELGFFGMASPIFAYLDKDDEGTVSRDEFEVLRDYQDPKWSLFSD
eukprot:TRINITY_DN19349_c0_g1_i1.p1 TRINITY_DN19349_c0_g1~~TRINITY_DN19349_c0_g1_i1.p1  ORF type:complete len:1554 (+),score=242.83 TRINITY_DN19349_c0_g1_i1:88-4749(+)